MAKTAVNKGWSNITPLDSKRAAEVGRKGGLAKKGSKHINTYIQEMMEDEDFEAYILDAKKGVVEYKGAPVKAIIVTAITKAVNGDDKAREWLAKYGWSQRQEIDATVRQVTPIMALEESNAVSRDNSDQEG